MKKHISALVGLALLAGVLALGRGAPADDGAADEKVLKDAGVAADRPGLLDFFRQRTPSDGLRKEVEALIRRLGDDDFEEREKATAALRARGAPAAPLLRAALKSPDAEIAARARRCLEEMAPGLSPLVPEAAARLTARRAPPGAVAVLLDYLPAADDADVEDEVLAALLALTPGPGKADPALVAALADPLPVRRAAAAHVLGRKGDKEQTEAVRKLLVDKDARVRWRAALGLLTVRDKAAVPALVDLLADGPYETAWQAEEVLLRLAGDKAPPAASFTEAVESRRKSRDLWAAWWKDNADKVDLARWDEGDRLLGLTLGVEYNTNRVWECNPDGTIRWEIRNLSGPMEAQILPSGLVLIAESNGHSVSERDQKGVVKWEKKIDGEATGCQRLRNGNTFVSTYNSVMEFAPDGTKVYGFALESGSNAIRKARNGNILYVLDGEIVEADTAGKRVRSVPLPRQSMYVGIQDLPGDRFLVANSSTGRVLEVDKTGKILWEGAVPGACGVERLPNGHTLVATSGKVVELTAEGKQVWEKTVDGYARRVHRR